MKHWTTKDTTLNIRIKGALKRELQRSAKRADVSVSEMTCRFVEEGIEREKRKRRKSQS